MANCRSCAAACRDDDRFCAHCGAPVTPAFSWKEFSRREKTRETPSSLSCPRCRSSMVCAVYGAFAVDECRDCAGIWFDRSEFAPMIEKFRDGKRAALGPDSVYGSKRAPLSESQVRYLPCPRCGDLMARFNYAVSSGVILDRCGKDGVWMDAGELERIVDFLGTSAPSPLPQTPPASASRPTFEPPRRPSGFSLESFLDLIFYGS